MGRISFQSEYPGYHLPDKVNCRQWIKSVVEQEGHRLGIIQYIFCSDDYLLEINKQFLSHDYYTDIITFDYTADNNGRISGDLFISIDRVTANASHLNLKLIDELYRVMIHGILHLIGYQDKTKNQIKEIRAKENIYIQQIQTLQSLPKNTK